ncbi:MAG: hypothetical protein AAB534_03375 [Patescibacteria group bacterium]
MSLNRINFILALLLFIFTIPLHAQTLDLPVSNLPNAESFLSIKTTPTNPGPRQKVTATLIFYQTDTKKANISWYLNAELKEKKIGKTSFEFETGGIGSFSSVAVVIDTFEGEVFQKEIVLRPAEVNLVANAETYTPPFYKGRALYTQKTDVRITAIPEFLNSDGQKIKPQNLMYKWQQGNSVLGEQSGVGRNSITVPGETITRPLDIRVEVSTLDERIKANGSIVVRKGEPKVLIYEKNPLLGLLLNQKADLLFISEKEITLEAVPYFFSVPTKNSSGIEYFWTQNSQKIESGDEQSSIILRQTEENMTGNVNIGVRVTNKDNQLQSDSFNTEIILGN